MPEEPDISVVIPTRGRLEALAMTLGGLAKQELEGANVEILVICSGAQAEALRPSVENLAAGRPHQLTVLERPTGGAAGARNAGIDASKGKFILFLNDDTPPASADLIRGHLEAILEQDDPWRGVMGPCSWHPALEQTPVMEWLARTGKSHDYAGMEREGAPTAVLYANNLSMHRRALERVGGFDERFAAYGWAEYDLGLRLSDHGFRLAFRPHLAVWHHHLHTLSDSLRRMEAVGTAANLLDRVHSQRNGLVTPAVTGARGRLGRFVAPLATRVRVPRRMPGPLRDQLFRTLHFAVLARGYAAPPLSDDPSLRGGLRSSSGVR